MRRPDRWNSVEYTFNPPQASTAERESLFSLEAGGGFFLSSRLETSPTHTFPHLPIQQQRDGASPNLAGASYLKSPTAAAQTQAACYLVEV